MAASDTLSYTTTWRTMHNSAKEIITTSPFALITSASKNFNAGIPLVKKVLGGQMFPLPIGRLTSMDSLKDQWCLAHFATPTDSNEFQTYLRQQTYELNCDMNYASDSIHSAKWEMQLFIQGHFDSTIDQIVQCVANFILFSRALVSIPSPWKLDADNPMLINMLIQLANSLLLEDNKALLTKTAQSCPHLLFTVFGYFQDILGEFWKLITTGRVPKTIQKDLVFPDIHLDALNFNDIHLTFDSCSQQLLELLRTGASDPKIPGSFRIIHPLPATPFPSKPPTDEHVRQLQPRRHTQAQALTADSFAQALAMLQQGLKGHSKGGQRERKPPSPSTGKGDWLEITQGHTLKEILPLPKGLRFAAIMPSKALPAACPSAPMVIKPMIYSRLMRKSCSTITSRRSTNQKPNSKWSRKYYLPSI